MADSQTITRQVAGLFTQFSPLAAPSGALSIADNAVIDREGMVSNRRGFGNYGFGLATAPGGAWEFRRKLVVLDGTTLKYDAAGGVSNYTSWTGSFAAPAADVRIHMLEAHNSLYFTTSTGVMKADWIPPNTPGLAGLSSSLDDQMALVGTTPVWLAPLKFVSYRTVLTRTDTTGRLVVGEPSQQYWIQGHGVDTKSIGHVFTIPTGMRTGDYLEIYRTEMADTAADLGDRHYFVGKVSLIAGNSVATWTDTTDEGELGDELYTSPYQETISQANHRPPWCKHMALYKGHVFYGNIKREQSAEIRLVDRDALVTAVTPSRVKLLVLPAGATNTYYAGAAEDSANQIFKKFTGGVEAEDIRNTALSLERVINRDATNSTWYAKYFSGLEDLPGRLQIYARSVTTGQFQVEFYDGADTAFEPTPLSISAPLVESTSKVARSKFGIPEAVPQFNTMEIGRPGFAILGMASLKNGLLIFKEDGLYSISGETDGAGGFNFVVDEVDPTIRLLCPESVVTLDNAVFAMTSQGVCRAFEGGSAIVSRPIERDLKDLSYLTNFGRITHAFGDEGEHKYHLCTQEAEGNTFTPLDWVYDYITNTWTRWRKDISCGLVLSTDRKIYLAHATQHIMLQERKDFAATDHRDELLAFGVTAKTTVTYDGATHTKLTGTYAYESTYQDLIAGWTFNYASITSRILSSVNTSGTTFEIVLEDVVTLPAAPFDALVGMPIFLDVEWMAEDAGNVGAIKQFSQVQHYRLTGTPFHADLGFLADKQAAYTWILGTGLGANNPTLRSEVPLEHQRTTAIKHRLLHAVAGEKVDILQSTWDLRPYSSRT